ncbi:MAG: glycosyltransferase [Cryobacterium sp.]|nr:glycosyltransferase [Cryobacterium sp.]
MILIRPVPSGSTDRPPRVSVVIPSYNYGRFLDECLTSVLGQDGVDLDVTVVDDGSTDDTVEIVTAWTRCDPRVRLVRHETNQGHIQTFNDALNAATAEFVVKMDADDLLPPGSLERSSRILRNFPQAAFVYGYPLTFTDDAPTGLSTRETSWSVWAGHEWIRHILRRGHNVIMQPEVMIRRSALDQTGGHRAEIPEASDLNLWLRLASVGSVARGHRPGQGRDPNDNQSMQRTIHSGHLSDLGARRSAMELFLTECRDRLDDPDGMRAIAHRSLARESRRLVTRARDLGTVKQEPINEYLALAAALEERPRSARPRSLGRLSPGRVFRNLEDRVRWRRWRRYGV